MKEFNLSDKMCTRQGIQIEGAYDIGDVKEFIKLLKERIDKIDLEEEASIQDYLIQMQDEVDNLAGDKLI